MKDFYFSKVTCDKIEFIPQESFSIKEGFLYLPQSYNEVYGLQELCESLESLERLQSLERFTFSEKDYRDVNLEKDSDTLNAIVYCDPPYKGTDAYAVEFDHEAFYDWCEKQSSLVVVSEYSMPESRFIRVASKAKRQIMNGKGSGKLIEEGLFIPKAQEELWQEMTGSAKAETAQLELIAV